MSGAQASQHSGPCQLPQAPCEACIAQAGAAMEGINEIHIDAIAKALEGLTWKHPVNGQTLANAQGQPLKGLYDREMAAEFWKTYNARRDELFAGLGAQGVQAQTPAQDPLPVFVPEVQVQEQRKAKTKRAVAKAKAGKAAKAAPVIEVQGKVESNGTTPIPSPPSDKGAPKENVQPS